MSVPKERIAELQRVTLERMKLACMVKLSPTIANSLDLTMSADWISGMLVARVTAHVLGEKLKEARVQYPINWYEAVKERFAPAWFRQRWPVVWNVTHIDVRALYPDISIPDQRHYVTLNRQDGITKAPRDEEDGL